MKMGRAVLAVLLAAAPLWTQAALLRVHRSSAIDTPGAGLDAASAPLDDAIEEADQAAVDESSEDEGLRGLQDQVTKLVTRSQTDKEGAAAEAKGLSEVSKLINVTLQPAILKEHDLAEAEIKALRGAFDKCKVDFSDGSPLGNLFAQGDKADKKHQDCRKKQGEGQKDSDDCQTSLKSLKHAKDAACGAFEAIKREPSKAAADCKASPAQEYGDWLKSNLHRFKDKVEEYDRLEKECTDATNAYNAQVPVCESKASAVENMRLECDTVQALLEDTSCSAQGSAQAACHSADTCYERAKTAYLDRKNILEMEEKTRKVNWRVFKRMDCLIGIIEKKGTAEDIETCRETTHSTKHLDLDFFDMPAKPECKIRDPVPCSEVFNTAKYGGLPENAPAAECKPCPGMAGSHLAVPRFEPSMNAAREVCVCGRHGLRVHSKVGLSRQ
jgi:hypothetical protein